jgi:hypothetical protein
MPPCALTGSGALTSAATESAIWAVRPPTMPFHRQTTSPLTP